MLLTAITLLAEDGPRNTGPDFGKASPFGLLVVVLLLVGTFFLAWSMNRHLKKLPASFDTEPEGSDTGAEDATAKSAAAEDTAAKDSDREPGAQSPG